MRREVSARPLGRSSVRDGFAGHERLLLGCREEEQKIEVAMAKKPPLTAEQVQQATDLLNEIRTRLDQLSDGDRALLFALRRRIYIRLSYDERGTPAQRSKLKNTKWKEQRGKCSICNEDLPVSEAELDRLDAVAGYTAANTQLIHHACHRKQQADRGFA
jgi:hypothetical protein